MITDKFNAKLHVNDIIVFTTTPHRGTRPDINVGIITKITDNRVHVSCYDNNLFNNGFESWAASGREGRKTYLNSTKNVVRW